MRENPLGGGSFVRSLRWLGTQSPLRGFSCLAASLAAKIPRRRTPRIFKAHSEAQRQPGLQPPSRASINAVVAPIRRFFWFIFCLRDVALDTSDCKRPWVRTFSPVPKQVRNRRSDWITTGLCPSAVPLLAQPIMLCVWLVKVRQREWTVTRLAITHVPRSDLAG